MMQQWLAPVSPEQACGPNLEYDADFLALEDLVRVRHEQEFRRDDGVLIALAPAEIPWPRVLEQAQTMLTRSKDLRLAILLTRALLHVEGFTGIAQGLALIRALLQDHWDGLHPGLEPDDGDPIMRLNALAALNATDSVLGDVRASVIIDSRQHGRLSVRDLEVAQGRVETAGESRLGAPEFEGLLDAARLLHPELPTQAAAALQDLEALCSWLGRKIGRVDSPFLPDLQDLLQLVVTALDSRPGTRCPGREPVAGILEFRPDPLSQDNAAQDILGVVNCRDDVIMILGVLCRYLERNEPTNPVQLLLSRARRMMRMDFLELMRDLAPDGLGQAENILGRQPDGDD